MKFNPRIITFRTKGAAKILDSKTIDKAARLSIEDQRKMSERAAKLRAQTANR